MFSPYAPARGKHVVLCGVVVGGGGVGGWLVVELVVEARVGA